MISCSDEHEVLVTGRLTNAAILKRFEHMSIRAAHLAKHIIRIYNVTVYRADAKMVLNSLPESAISDKASCLLNV